jgi:hypothetical protein
MKHHDFVPVGRKAALVENEAQQAVDKQAKRNARAESHQTNEDPDDHQEVLNDAVHRSFLFQE